jgi:hypothetical protein
MPSYLEGYGEKQARRSRTLRWLILTPLALIIAGIALYFGFRDFSEHRRAAQFLELIQKKDYKGGYALWGCTDQKPCPQYPFDRFMEDWGPATLKNPEQATIADHIGCRGGVISFVRVPNQEDIQLWVDRRTGEIGFAPWRLKQVPPGFRMRLASLMWSVTQNCDPLIGP